MLRFWKRNFSLVPDFEPHSVIKVISGPNKNVKPPEQHASNSVKVPKNDKPAKSGNRSTTNEMGIQMISKKLFEQIFKNAKPASLSSDKIDL